MPAVNLHRTETGVDAELRLGDPLAEVEICVYPDSGKVGAWADGVYLMNRPEANLPYGDEA